jgi:aminopeptidase N
VPGLNLTRDEARERARVLRTSHYDITLDLTQGDQLFRSTTVITFDCTEPGTATFVDLVAPTVHEITLNGRAIDPAVAYADSRIAVDGLAASNELRVVADCAYMNTGEGLHRSVDPADGNVYLYTQFEVADARRVFATFEQPDLKATFSFTVTAPRDWELFSVSPTPEPEPVGDDAAVWRFAPTERISTYITALVAGPYHTVRDTYVSPTGQVVPMAVACRASLAEFLDAADIIEITKQGFDYFLPLFDRPYPFAKYDQLFVPEYNAGAMENAGCVTLVDYLVFRSKVTDIMYERRAETILHELAHMWFGDLVTMTWWNDLWLNESFATYNSVRCLAEATRFKQAWTTFANLDKTFAYRQDQLPSTHPIVAEINDLEDVEVNFDGITYAKGASVLKQLVAWVGSDNFFAGVRRYFNEHAWGNTTLQDLLGALEQESGRDLTSWSRDWLETAGPNIMRPEFTVDADGRFATFDVLQEAPAEYPTLRPHRMAIGLYQLTDEGLVRTHRVELDVTGARTAVPELVGLAQPDLVLLNDDDLTYARIRLDPRSLATVVAHIGDFTEPLPRTMCWAAAWDMTRDAEMPARDFVRLVLGGVDDEDDSIAQLLLRQAVAALENYSDIDWYPVGRQLLADASRDGLRAAEPGSDAQLTWAHTLAGVASTDADLALLAGLLDGSTTVPGLRVDAELRWSLLGALVKQGKATEVEIAAEQERDQTTAGQEHAAATLAMRPTAAAKADAWNSTVESEDLPNSIIEAVVGGFAAVSRDRLDLLRPYLPRYFEMVNEVWAKRTHHIAQKLIVGLYPSRLVEQATLDATDAFLAEGDPVPALRRLIIEQRDGVRRCLRAQEFDRQAGTR